MQENIDLLIDQGRWEDLTAQGSNAVVPLLNALHNAWEHHYQLEDELVLLRSRFDLSDHRWDNNHKRHYRVLLESLYYQEKITRIISTLGKIQDVRAWNPLVNLSNLESPKWPAQLIFEAVEEIESSFRELKRKRNIYCTNCFHKFVRYPQVSSLVCLLFHKKRLCNFSDEKWFIPLYHSGPFPVCRKCKGNTSYLENVNRVILLLDDMDAPFVFKQGILTVNWFGIKMPVDMHEIAINHCTNDDVTELVMKLKNDDDPLRKRLYKNIPVSLSKNLDLSMAKRNLLKNTFANIKIVESDTINRSGG